MIWHGNANACEFGNVLENGRKFERVRVVGNGLGNVVGRGFRNVCAIANAFATKLEHARESRRVTNTAKGP